MSEPRLDHVQCLGTRGLHRMAYWEWGDPANPHVVLCVHGLSRQGRDFDTLARALSDRCRVVCPDVAGRGQSQWLDDPMGYAVPNYVADMVTLAARVNAGTLDWVGTSMGGLIGLAFASLKGAPIRRLVLNDVGPTVEAESIERIREYLGVPIRWASIEEAADYLWSISASFGPHTREQWMALTLPQLKPDGDGFVPHYDPKIAVPIAAMTPQIAAAAQAMLWQAYDQMTLPTLLLRGAESDLLSPETAHAMTQRGPKARLVEFEGIGHAPMLQQPDQVQAIRGFLLEP
jgi:pimeloyl-ACP methyl ester carboxylesterase